MFTRLLLLVGLTLSLTSCMDPFPRTGGGGSTGGSTDGRGTNGTGDDTYGQSSPMGPSTSADPLVHVDNIQLTRNYTILYLTYTQKGQRQVDNTGRVVPNGFIAFDSRGQLVAANGARVFKFIKADNIPIRPAQLNTYAGQQYSFAVYFEPLDKGLEHFDLFECNDYDHLVCWNIYNLYVRNPADPVMTPPVQTQPAPMPGNPSRLPGETPMPAPAPTTPKPTEPPAVQLVFVSGIVSSSLTNKPVTATIDYQLSNKSTPLDSVQSFSADGLYRMYLNRGQVYTYVASAKGYLPTSGTLDLTKATNNQKITRHIVLKPLSVGTKITLQNIYFAMSKADLLPASFAELDKLVTMMDDNPQMRIRLEGHTDIVGDKAANLQLSRDRVLACQSYLVRKGIDVVRIETIGYGDTRPILTKGTDEDRKVNRRVEFSILAL
ncbi:OmpA family protein [Fibrella arboris]|uniref:OmpA family protein n=1 Tax=Fibrella arboris TaxID=3242486 RepID=UPI00351F977B